MLPRIAAVACCATLAAQTTWIVDVDSRPGTHFTSIDTAVAAASPGDTLLVRRSLQGLGYFGFAVTKGLTIVSDGASLNTRSPVAISGIPANQTLRFAGFTGPNLAPMLISVANCQGTVILEDLHAREYGAMFPTTPSITISGCTFVALHAVENFGSPAVQVDNSRVLLTRCLLGVTSLGIGGGQCIGGQNATIDVVEPRFDAAYAGIPAIALNQCTLRLAGSSNSYVQGGAPFGGPASPAVQANGGTVRIDPAVALNPFVAGTPVGGSAAVTFASTPGSFVVGNNPNGVLTITYTAAPGASLYGLLGVPAAPLPTPFGDALLDPNLFVVVTATTVGGSGRHDVALPIPGGIPPGAAFATQGVVVQGGPPQLGIGCQFVVH